jgi:hypothetical protein
MGSQIPWSVEAKLLCEIKELANAIKNRNYILSYPDFASFPIPGTLGTLYLDESTGLIYVWSGNAYILLTVGITSINTLTSSSQAFATGLAGSDFNISSVGAIHTFNLPTSSAINRGLLSPADWTTFNNKQDAITLTTTGSSGSSTFLGNTLNIPNYTLSGLGGVPTSRTLTINGVNFDLSANRSWSVGTVTSIDFTSPLTGGTITGSGTVGIPQASGVQDGYLSSADWTTFNNKQNAVTSVQVYFIPGEVGFPSVGATTYTNAGFSGANVMQVFRNGLLQFDRDPGDGDTYFTFAGTTVTFSAPLGDGEKIMITSLKLV